MYLYYFAEYHLSPTYKVLPGAAIWYNISPKPVKTVVWVRDKYRSFARVTILFPKTIQLAGQEEEGKEERRDLNTSMGLSPSMHNRG